ncbi:endoplasmic reticulum membrane-associated RNA degradation protein-like isoform X2 [Artemia franciscana]|uniref:endoplasmic reticulum membrane-associated RNA degradation protein-like isoform X2 n=1 Tax=Artemia franciscana TaxID=6661 RepID=UPI0032DA138C
MTCRLHLVCFIRMATLEDKLLGEKLEYYCSSSEDEECNSGDECKTDGLVDKSTSTQEKSAPLPWSGSATNTGPKGVVQDYIAYKSYHKQIHEQKEMELIALSKKLTLSCQTEAEVEAAKAAQEKDDMFAELLEEDDEFLKEYTKLKLKEFLEAKSRYSFGELIEVETSDQFLKEIDNEKPEVTVVFLIYERGAAGCDGMISAFKFIAKEYPNTKFCSIRASIAGLSYNFKTKGVPAINAYKNGQIIANFVQLFQEFGNEVHPGDIENFLIEKEKTPSNVVSYFSGYISELFSQSGGNIHSGVCGTDRDNEPTAELDRFIRILEGRHDEKDLYLTRIKVHNILKIKDAKFRHTPLSREVFANEDWISPADGMQDLLFEEALQIVQNSKVDGSTLILFTTSYLERTIGDLLASRGEAIPFLLRDALATQTLKEEIGSWKVSLLRIITGTPKFFNLRNLAWHGFPQHNELPSYVGLGLLKFIFDSKPRRLETIKRRPLLILSPLQMPPVDYDWQNNEVMKLITLVPPGMKPFWKKAQELYESKSYGVYTVIMLPQLEHLLRVMFCIVNNCVNRALTAEATLLYTTLEVVLDKSYEGFENKLLTEVLGKQVSTFFYDLFNYVDGPRLRDRISHGQVDISCIPKELAQNLLVASTLALTQWATFIVNTDRDTQAKVISIYKYFGENIVLPESTSNEINKVMNGYSSQAHPLAVASLMKINLENEKELFLDETYTPDSCRWRSCIYYDVEFSSEITGYYRRSFAKINEVISYAKTYIDSLKRLRNERKLRSRQRENLEKVLQFWPSISKCILQFLKEISFVDIASGCLTDLESERKHIRYLKRKLKESENLNSLVRQNQWKEALDISVLLAKP